MSPSTNNMRSLLVQNAGFLNTQVAIQESGSPQVLLPGGDDVLIDSWGFGRVNGPSGAEFVNNRAILAANRTESLTGSMGYVQNNFFSRRRPRYDDIGMAQVIDVKSFGAQGDGKTDDTAALNSVLALAANMSSIAFFPHGVYVIKNTLKVPNGSRIIGQAWSQIMASGSRFEDVSNPRVAVQVGNQGDVGVVEIQDMLFTVSGPTAGAVLMEWNIREALQGSAGLWGMSFLPPSIQIQPVAQEILTVF